MRDALQPMKLIELTRGLALLSSAAILESSSGDVFVKMTGPKEVVKDAAPAMEKMVRDAAAR
jgi:hypothetical protein